MYEKGVQTRNHLYRISKQVFYARGYEKAKIKEIVERADTPIGLFTYYFKTKDNIVHEIYNEYFAAIDELIIASKIEGFENSILRHAALSWIYYDRILSDENNRRFYYEILKKGSNYRVASDYISDTYRRYIQDYHLVVSEREFDNYVFIDFGGRREYFLNYFERPLPDSVDEIIFLVNGIIPRMLGIDQHAISSLLYKGIQIAKTIDSSQIHFLDQPS
jgi:AcrR family transcriptional regulator